MGYKFTPRVRIDLGDLGDNNGTPFFVEIRNPRFLTFEQKMEFAKFQELQDKPDELRSALKETARDFIKAWNLIDMESGEPVDLTASNALDRVPSEVVEAILSAIKKRGTEDEETKNSSEQSDKS